MADDKSGILCQGRNPVNINDGTMCTAQSPKPGIQGERHWWESAWDEASADASWAAGQARDGALWVGDKAYQGGVSAYHGAVWVGGEIRDGAVWTEGKVVQGYHYVAGGLEHLWTSQLLPMLKAGYHFTQSEIRGIWCLLQAREFAYLVLWQTVKEEALYELPDILGGVIGGLIDMLITIGTSAILGGVIGGAIGALLGAIVGGLAGEGVGAAPGAVIGARIFAPYGFSLGMEVGIWYVTIIGLKFLLFALKDGFEEIFTALEHYVTWSWQAKDMGPALQQEHLRRAGKELARAFGILMRFLLLALILYVMKKAIEFGGGAKGEAKALDEATKEVGKSSLGTRFAQWFKGHFEELKGRMEELKNRATKPLQERVDEPEGQAKPNPKPKPQVVKARYKGSKTDINIPEDQKPEFDKLLKQREDARALRDKLESQDQLSDAERAQLRDARRTVTDSSRDLGELGADQYMKQTYGDSAVKIYPPEGTPSRPGDFDQVWKVTDTDGNVSYKVIEAKGGVDPQLGTRSIDGIKYQQGTPEYYNDIVKTMEESGDPAQMDTATRLSSPNASVEYLKAETLITKDGSAIKGVNVSEFDLTPTGNQ